MLRHPAPPAHAITRGRCPATEVEALPARFGHRAIAASTRGTLLLDSPDHPRQEATFRSGPGHDTLGHCDSTLSDATALGR